MGNDADLIAAVRAGGKVWSQPMFYQYSNKAGGILTRKGLSWLRDNWAAAIANDSRLLQFVTWNDYGEETILAPSTGGAYTVPRINAWYVEKWKTGRDPEAGKDEVRVRPRGRRRRTAEGGPPRERAASLDEVALGAGAGRSGVGEHRSRIGLSEERTKRKLWLQFQCGEVYKINPLQK